MKKYLILSLLAFALLACNKPLLEYNSEFEGTWFCDHTYFDNNGIAVTDQFVFSGTTGTYSVSCKDTCSNTLCDCLAAITGKAEINKQRTQFRLNSQTPRVFTINAEPYESGGSWYLEIDGVKYKKQ